MDAGRMAWGDAEGPKNLVVDIAEGLALDNTLAIDQDSFVAKPGRHLEGAETRERVLGAAASLLAEQGYAATSISQICREAEVHPASIYWAFGSKEGLFAAVMERAAEAFFEGLPVKGERDPLAGVDELGRMFEARPEFLRLLLVLSLERREGDPAILEAARRVRQRATDRIAEALEPHVALDDRARASAICGEVARFALMLLDGAFVGRQIEPDTTDLRQVFRTIAMGVRATLDQLVAEARALKSDRKRHGSARRKGRDEPRRNRP
jgi:AcrR family transcriptional regulator